MRAFRALTLNTVRASFRNRTALFFTLGLAVLFMVLFGLIFNGNSFSLTYGVVDNDRTAAVHQLTQALGTVTGVTVEQGSSDQELDRLRHGKVTLVIEVPPGYAAALSGAHAPVQLQVIQSSAGSQVTSIANQVLAQVLNGIVTHGATPAVTLAPPRAASVNDVTAIDFFLPAMIAYIVLQSGINFVAIGLVDMRVRKVLRRLRATPLTRAQILGAQVVGGALTVALQILVLIALGLWAFHAHNSGNWAVAAVPMVLGIGAFVGIGFLLTSAVRTSEAARGVASAVAFPMMFLSGIFFPIDLLPAGLQTAVHILPLTWLSDALHQVMNDGAGLPAIALDCAVLAGWALVTFALATWRFRWD